MNFQGTTIKEIEKFVVIDGRVLPYRYNSVMDLIISDLAEARQETRRLNDCLVVKDSEIQSLKQERDKLRSALDIERTWSDRLVNNIREMGQRMCEK